jgi:ArsR family transcriptional regulator
MSSKKVKFFKALGDETRLKIVSYLLENDYFACDFVSMTKKDQTTVSRHLKVLVEANILSSKKNGRNITYKIKDDRIKDQLRYIGIKSVKNKYCCKEV